MTHHLPALAILSLAAAALDAPPVGWRGDGTGRYPSATPPLVWSTTSNVLWKTAMSNFSNASPLPVGDRVFVCSEPSELLCLSAQDGSILWKRQNGYEDVGTPEEAAKFRELAPKAQAMAGEVRKLEGIAKRAKEELKKTPDSAELTAKADEAAAALTRKQEEFKALAPYMIPPTHNVTGYSSATPVTDGSGVYMLFGTGVAVGYDFDGKRRWARKLERPTHVWGHSASPVLVGNLVIVHILNVTALNKDTGETVWTAESSARWGSPAVATIGGSAVVITAGGDILRAADGKSLAKRVSNLTYATPVIEGGSVYFAEYNGKALKFPSAVADDFKVETLWTAKLDNERYYASPVVLDGLLFTLQQKGRFSVIDTKTGETVSTNDLGIGKSVVYPSVTLGGKHLFVSNEGGETVVLEPGRECKEVARFKFDPFRANPVFEGGRVYIRTLRDVYCLGK